MRKPANISVIIVAALPSPDVTAAPGRNESQKLSKEKKTESEPAPFSQLDKVTPYQYRYAAHWLGATTGGAPLRFPPPATIRLPLRGSQRRMNTTSFLARSHAARRVTMDENGREYATLRCQLRTEVARAGPSPYLDDQAEGSCQRSFSVCRHRSRLED